MGKKLIIKKDRAKKTVLISAGGTATAWFLVKTIQQFFSKNFIVIVTDLKPKELIPASKLSDYFYQVPEGIEERYIKFLEIFEKHGVNFFIPLADEDLKLFYRDNFDLLNRKVVSTSPPKATVEKVGDKLDLFKFCQLENINTPRVYWVSELEENQKYLVKLKDAFGSREVRIIRGEEIKFLDLPWERYIIQEICYPPELTVEIFFYQNKLSYVIRERLEVKAGVCTKARFVKDNEIEEIIYKIAKKLELPMISCLQFMRNDRGWALTDFNLRMGAGSALSAKAGWHSAKALFTALLEKEDPFIYLIEPKEGTIIVRVYEELLMS
ncbi:MAG: ATP-grasp domain-containing protein [Thermodesulfobacteriaceae bacterium]|nr:ATP-grasp domain-containing protein [Thermodesulfobacteriaceae bacterium]MCX8041457.1 ATP-grasp domain-containing protein [Thermodesulfobacteriaceae bacterium]MDW8135760.1 ATP-grasp domain-containing protein [Thermodesulfobacterium sp.]